MPKLSVIIPVYNVAPHVGGTLDSVVAAAERLGDFEPCRGGIPAAPESGTPRENGPLVEVICVDDGSTDMSGAILDAYVARVEGGGFEPCRGGIPAATEAKSISFRVLHQPNAGVSAARNAALDLATGEWVMMLDGDDTWEPDLLVKLFAEIAAHPDCELACFRVVEVDERGDIIRRHPHDCEKALVTGDDIFLESRGRYSSFVWGTCDKVIRRSVIERHCLRYACGMRRSEDTLFAHELLSRCERVLLLPEIEGYHYLMRQGSAVHVRDGELPKEPFCLFSTLIPIWRKDRKPGLRRRLQHIAAGAPSLASGDDFDVHVRKEAIEFLLNDRIFKYQILPFMLFHGTLKSRLFAAVYLCVPTIIRRQILRRIGACNHGR